MQNNELVHYINQALRANYSMKKDFDYVVQDGEVLIVDPFTGRIMKGRQWSDGLHQAVEAKEGVKINQENKTVATITFQNLFRMYKKLSGMTGTAKTEEEEFRNIYNMYVIAVPTNKPVARIDYPDLVYPTQKGKYKAIIKVIEEKHKTGQPILVGTIAVETSELISEMLTKKGIKHEVLNAKNHEREAEIISHAGEKGRMAAEVVHSFNEVSMQIMGMIIKLSPVGVFCLIVPVVAKNGPAVLGSMAMVLLVAYIGYIFHMFFIYSLSVKFLAKLSPVEFFKKMMPAIVMAFSSASSVGTLPLNMECTQKLGAKKEIASFVLPLGATINMDGTAIYQGVCAVFIAACYGINLTLPQMLTIVLTATLASIGTAGVPGAGMVMLAMVLTSVGLPVDGIALVAGVDRIFDMGRTTVNITGDAACAIVVSNIERKKLLKKLHRLKLMPLKKRLMCLKKLTKKLKKLTILKKQDKSLKKPRISVQLLRYLQAVQSIIRQIRKRYKKHKKNLIMLCLNSKLIFLKTRKICLKNLRISSPKPMTILSKILQVRRKREKDSLIYC